MADKKPQTGTPIGSGTNPNVNSQDGGINPSAPSTGTEGWGRTTDERRNVSLNDPEATRAGQMKGNPGNRDSQVAQVERAEREATTNKAPSRHRDDEQADLSRCTSASAFSMKTSNGGADHTFRCADAGNADCRWETSGNTETEVMERAEEHERLVHGLADWTEALRNRVRDAIHPREAA